MSDREKQVIVVTVAILLFTGLICVLMNSEEERVEVQDFYVSEAYDKWDNRKYYIVSNSEMECKVKEPDLILYCKEHVGEKVRIKIRYRYDKTNDKILNVEYISIEEE